jgi:NADH-quinone oxidoreductase subunit E
MSVRRLAPKEVQPASFAFSAENAAWAKTVIARYPEGRQASAVIPLLWRAQEQHDNWVSEAMIRTIADMLDMPYIRVLEVATFYTMFQLQPVGKKAHVQVCGTTPCQLRGANDLLKVCRDRIHHDAHHLSADGDFSWEEVECLGACVNAPMVQVFKDTYEDLTVESFNRVLDGFATGKPPQPGPQNGRQYSAPLGGVTTLTGEGGNSGGASKQPALADTDAKKPGAAANVQERPAPKPPADDATRKGS